MNLSISSRLTISKLIQRIDQATGSQKADLVLKNARFLNVVTSEFAQSDIAICGDRIVGVYEEYNGDKEIDCSGLTVVPGFIDTHLHIESCLVTPGEFERCVLSHGVTTAICDPHEIANVLGKEGIEYFLSSAENMRMDLRVQLSSCVPATDMETSGASLTTEDLLSLCHHPKVIGLAEFMNFRGVVNKDPVCLNKLAAFLEEHIDGHSPLLGGKDLNAYLACGISTEHEATSFEEGEEKLRKGVHLLIREGSITKDIETLIPLLNDFTSAHICFCTDDRNPYEIAHEGHIDFSLRKAIALGASPAAVYRSASLSAARAFRLFDRGVIAPGYLADMVLLEDFEQCRVHSVICHGFLVNEQIFGERTLPEPVGRNSIKRSEVKPDDFCLKSEKRLFPVIGILPQKVITEKLTLELPVKNGEVLPDLNNDVLKVFVLERHGRNENIAGGFTRGFGLKSGALASSVGHDSHNICVVGTNNSDMALAVNHLRELQGGYAIVKNGEVLAELALPIAGLMSDQPYESVQENIFALRESVRLLGCSLEEPFQQLAFIPLSVIPHLKITDCGIVDVDNFKIIPL